MRAHQLSLFGNENVSSNREVIRDLSVGEAPLFRMKKVGPEGLSETELLAVALDVDLEQAEQVAGYARQEYGSLSAFLREAPEAELVSKKVRLKKVMAVRAALELLSRSDASRVRTVRRLEDVVLLLSWMKHLPQEHFVVVCLNTRDTVITTKTVSVGTLDSTLVHPREVFRHAIKVNAARVILAHNHPSGDPTPSDEDLKMTERLVECGWLLGIYVLDHVVLATDRSTSMGVYKPEWFREC